MTIATGTRLGAYEIVGSLGAGGMGEVYRAVDTKLGREVAIKTLPAGLATDVDRLARFEREAQLLASLNHAHIASIYGLDEDGGRRYLAMELVDGITLEEKLKAGPLPVEDALQLALQIAQALEAAHDKGVVHRDLKPANVMVTRDGVVKVLDFGLAKAFSTEAEGDIGNSPALSQAMTQAGLILGTAGYMAPEQASGQATDRRADIWAFGVVLYEMLTGQPVFKGESVPHILADVLKSAPDWSGLPKPLHPRITLLLERCLRKKPRERYHSIADARIDIEDVLKDPAGAASALPFVADVPARRSRSMAFGALLVVAGVAAGFGVWQMNIASPSEPRQVVRITDSYPSGMLSQGAGPSVAISRDGRRILFRRPAAGGLYIRPMETGEPVLVQGTLGFTPDTPTFSADGESIFFRTDDGQLRRTPASGGALATIASDSDSYGIGVSNDGSILYSTGFEIRRVAADGGQPETLVSIRENSQIFQRPQQLPGGDWILYVARRRGAPPIESEIVVESPFTGERRVLRSGATDARYVPTGHIVYGFAGVLYALPFDAERAAVTGGAVPVIDGVDNSNIGLHQFDISDSGHLVYIAGAPGPDTDRRLAITDEAGRITPIDTPTAAYETVRASPDGTLLAMDTAGPNGGGIVWIYELAGTSAMRRLTFEGNNLYPVWSPDGEEIAFQSDREGDVAIFAQRADGAGGARRLTTPADGEVHIPESWSPDGRFLSFSVQIEGTRTLWILSLDDGSIARFGNFESIDPIGSVFSPDSRWLAYYSRTPGVVALTAGSGVYLEPFPATGARYQVPKVARDFAPVWSRDGTAIHFIGATAANQLVTVTLSTEPALSFGSPRLTPFTLAGGRLSGSPRGFDALPGGRFIGSIRNEALDADSQSAGAQMKIVLNWFEELKRLAPTE